MTLGRVKYPYDQGGVMKRTLVQSLFLSLFLMACATNTDWDSGAEATEAHLYEQRQEQVETTRRQLPSSGPATDQRTPF